MPSLNERKKIGLLGGTFDPVHNGHLAAANHVLQALALDAIWFIPASQPPHKTGHGDGGEISSFTHRIAMLEKAVGNNGRFVVSDIEAKRSEPSYSIDTITILIRQIGKQAELFFIIGADAFLEIDTWKKFTELPTLVNFVVLSRPGYPPEKVGEAISHNFTGYILNESKDTWCAPNSKGCFILQHMEPVPISSTEIRRKVRNGENISGLVPPAVEFYINKEKLYIR